MKSIRWKLVFIYLTLVFIVMIISGTFILLRLSAQENAKAEEELKRYAIYIYEQIIMEYDNPDDFQAGFENLFIEKSSEKGVQGNILNSDGKTIASTSFSEKSLFPDYKNSVVISALSGTVSFGMTTYDTDADLQGKEWFSYGYPVFDDSEEVEYVVYVQIDAQAVKESLRQTANTLVATLVLVLLLTSALGLIFANTITSPISALTKNANMFARGEVVGDIEVKSDDEIGQLTESFNYMAKELKKTVSELENENYKLEIVMKNMTDGVLAFDDKGNVIRANRIFYEMLGMDEGSVKVDEFLNKTKISYNDLRPNVITETMLKQGEKYLSISFIPYGINKENIDGVVVVLQDITKHRRLDDMRKEFVANVSHEIRTPLTTIKSYTETLLDGAIEDKETAIEFLQVINSATDRMALLSKDLLELSKLDTKQVRFDMRITNLIELADDCVKQNIIIAKGKEQALEFIRPQSKEMLIFADSGRITQVINNIISNAMKYSGEHASITLEICEEKDKYKLSVTDTGMGISKEDLKRIFERFYRVDKARSRAMGGNGLGLSIAKEIMEGHGGNIEAYSEVGKGTKMILTFPKH